MIDINKVDFIKMEGLVPAIIQDVSTSKVLMQGYMNAEALEKTISTSRVTFYSRSKKRLWTKGEESGNFLELVEIRNDCDHDSLLIKARPLGPTCHLGNDTCWDEENKAANNKGFIYQLNELIESRKDADPASSYTASLFQKGINKVAQKVGEEAVELVIEAKDDDEDLFISEAADLMYHYLVLLSAKGFSLADVDRKLIERHK